jgi:hypothetical protein
MLKVHATSFFKGTSRYENLISNLLTKSENLKGRLASEGFAMSSISSQNSYLGIWVCLGGQRQQYRNAIIYAEDLQARNKLADASRKMKILLSHLWA